MKGMMMVGEVQLVSLQSSIKYTVSHLLNGLCNKTLLFNKKSCIFDIYSILHCT